MKTGDNMKEHPSRLELRERIVDTVSNLLLPWHRQYYDG